MHGDEPVGRHRLGLALEPERRQRLDGDRVAHEPVRLAAQEDLAGLRRLLQPRRQVHRVAHREALRPSRAAGDDFTRVDPGAGDESCPPPLRELLVERTEIVAHVRRRARRAQGVVLMRHRNPEDGHDRVADELLHHALVALDRRAHHPVVARQHLPERLGVQPLAHLRGLRQVAEDDRDALAGLTRAARGRQWSGAAQAEPRPLRVLLPALGADAGRH